MAGSDDTGGSLLNRATTGGQLLLNRIVMAIAITGVSSLTLTAGSHLPVWFVVVWIITHTTLAVRYRDTVLRDYYSMGPAIRLLACLLWLVFMTLILRAVPQELRLNVHHLITGGLSSTVNTYIWYYQLDEPSYLQDRECIVARDACVLQILVIASFLHKTWLSRPVTWIIYHLLPLAGFVAFVAWALSRMRGKLYVDSIQAFIRQNLMRLFWWQDVGDVLWMVFVHAHHDALYKQIHRLGERKREMHIDLPIYEYRPLKPNQIRLLVIKPSRFVIGPVFEASLLHANLSELPAYEAISYRWGDDTKTDEIIVDYQSFRVTRSATEVLLSRRRWHKPRTIWLDAICINQADPQEKSTQVRLMRQIYAQAYRVVAFPSYEPELKLVEPLLNEEAIAESGAVDSFWNFRPLLANGNFTARWKAYRDILLFSEYFRRVWIVQEIVAGQEVLLYLHGFYVTWQTFMRAAARSADSFRMAQLELAGHTDESVTAGGGITIVHIINIIALIDNLRETPSLDIDTNGFRYGSPRTLQHLLEHAFNAEASDARDYVFSIIGLAADVPNDYEKLIPDYRKSVRQVFEDAARFLFVEHDHPSLVLLGRAGIGHTTQERKVPSWVPDPSERRMSVPHNQVAIPRTFQACGQYHTEVRSQISSSGNLRLNGFLYDAIRTINNVDLVDLNHEPGARHLALPLMRRKLTYLMDNIHFVQQQEVTNPPDIIEQMYRVFVADHVEGKRVRKEHKQTFEEMLRHFSQIAEGKDFMDMVHRSNVALGHNIWAPTLPAAESPTNLEIMAINAAFASACTGRRMAFTSSGQCCLVPALSLPDDQIFVPCGSMTPYLVRHDDSDTVQLVGEVYVHGIMYGEAVEESSKATWLTFR